MSTQTIRIDFQRRENAEWARENFPDAITDDDDRRKNTVPFHTAELTDRELDEIVAVAERSRAEKSGAGQTALTESERERIDFSRGIASVPHARSVKGIMLSEGVDDWTAFYDPTLTVDEHREVAERAAQDVRGERLDVREEDDPRGQLEGALAEQCDHARDAIEAVNAIRFDAGQEPIEPYRLNEIMETDLVDVTDTDERTPADVARGSAPA